MSKLIWIILVLVPAVLFARSFFTIRSKKRAQAVSNFKKQLDYLVWVVLFLIACELAYFIGTLIFG
jgi:hypothetical protein